MPDQSTAASWFVQHVLKNRFANESKGKKFSIENINKQVMSIAKSNTSKPSVNPSECSHCRKHFTNGSKPVLCPNCSKYKHKTKCTVSAASCPALSRPPQVPSPSATASLFPTASDSAILPSRPVSSETRLSSNMSSTASILFIPSDNNPTIPDNPGSTISLQSRGMSATASSTSGALTPPPTTSSTASTAPPIISSSGSQTVLNPLANSFAIQDSRAILSDNPPYNPRKQNARKQPAPSPEAAENEFLKRELNMAKTEIVKLETRVKDNERSLALYKARVSMFEERERNQAANNIHRSTSSFHPTTTSAVYPYPACPAPSCTPCCCHHHHCSSKVVGQDSTFENISLSSLHSKLDLIQQGLQLLSAPPKSLNATKDNSSQDQELYKNQELQQQESGVDSENSSKIQESNRIVIGGTAQGNIFSDPVPSTQGVPQSPSAPNLDCSTASMEEFIPALDNIEIPNDLNSLAMTTQLVELEL